MCVMICDINALMAKTISDCCCTESHINQKRNMAMSNVMNPDSLDICFLCSPVHFSVEIVLGDQEHPIIISDIIEHAKIILHFICKKLLDKIDESRA